MPKSLVLGNGNILIAFDRHAQVKDFYFPYVGLENQTSGWFVHKIGVFVQDRFSWFDDGSWEVQVDCEKETLAGFSRAIHKLLKVTVNIRDVVYNEKNIFIRKFDVVNDDVEARKVKIFFHQAFELYESHRGDTAYFDPVRNVIVHYKGRRVFLINTRIAGRGFDDYSVGLFKIEGKEGTYKDAEDGSLHKNPIEHGMVDSVVGVTLQMEPKQCQTIYYWVVVAKEYRDVAALNSYVLEKSPQYLMKSTQDFWHAWITRENFTFYDFDPSLVDLFKKSLLIMRTHVDNNGSILASGDSDMLQYGRDTYSYMWPRDAAYTAIALAASGDHSVAKRFFEFCREAVMDEGYFLHKYRPDSSLGSSWHPWVRNGMPSLPIQEDETALIVYALWEYYQISKNLEFIEQIYDMLIKRTGYFMVEYTDRDTGLPKSSYDIWEEKYGIHTYTASCVFGALVAASKFAKLLGKTESEKIFYQTAERMKGAILKYLYDEEMRYFYKMIHFVNGEIRGDRTIDISSVYGIYKFGILPLDDGRLQSSIETARERLTCRTGVGGIARYEGDAYYSVSKAVPGNPWFITSLWLAQYEIETAKTIKALDPAKKWLEWVSKYALSSGILSEQINPYTGAQLSVAPLTWSHSEYVVTVLAYISKMEQLMGK